MKRSFRDLIRLQICGLLCILPLTQVSASQLPPAVPLNFEPPRIIVSEEPMRLMLIDGAPVRVAIESTQLEFVVNTDWTIFHDLGSRSWFVLDQGSWLRNNMLSSGSWISTQDLPRDFLTLQVNSDWPEVAAALPPRAPSTPPLPVVISYEPTELVLIDGDAVLESVAGSGLQFVANTANDLFILDGRYYLLLSGRWFTTRNVHKKWYPVRELPQEFAAIPPDHPRAHVLAAVPGTEQARLAMAQAAQPVTRMVAAGDGSGLAVPWIGEPQFVEIEGTALRRGQNTPYAVILNNNFYYLCHEGAWYRSGSPTGPWAAAREIPEAIYSIPPTDPAYNVTFVRVKSFDDSTGQVAYDSTGGYYGRYSTGSTVVYGTGWYHPGYYDRSAYWRYPNAYGYWGPSVGPYGPYGFAYPYGYSRSKTYDLDTREKDWEWNLDGSKRRVYRYGPQNVVGGEYVMPESDGYKGETGQRPDRKK